LPAGEHILHGKGKIFGWWFDSDAGYPITFKFVSSLGYVYMCGRGELVSPSGNEHLVGREDSVEAWLPLLAGDDKLKRERAAQALGYMTQRQSPVYQQVVRVLEEKAAHDDQAVVRRNSAQALGRIGAFESLATLTSASADPDEMVRMAASAAVRRLRSPSTEPVR
jgi:hypothetical protein